MDWGGTIIHLMRREEKEGMIAGGSMDAGVWDHLLIFGESGRMDFKLELEQGYKFLH